MIIPVNINDVKKEIIAESGEILLDVLRREGYLGVKRGCSEGSCGSCIVLIDNLPRKTCIMFIGQVKNKEIITIEGLGTPEHPHPLQDAFVEEAGVQCGYCIPGMILSANSLILKNHDPTDNEIKEALAGNLCRCTGYVKQIKAVKNAAKKIRDKEGAK